MKDKILRPLVGTPRRGAVPAERPYQLKHVISRSAAIVWLLGLLLLGGRAIGQNLVFIQRLRTARPVTDESTLALFARCCEDMGVSKPVRLLETDYVKSPALYGFFRPCLLLPANVMGQFSPAEQRHIFLHELAHVKRRDMAMHWVATVFRLVHWFNPVLWFGFQRMAADRELACDELALSSAGEAESCPYGKTVLKLLELCARPAVLPGLMGILEEKSQMTRRILMIARFKQQAGWPILALLLLTGLGLVTLTDAQTEKAKPQPAATPRPDLTGEVRLTNGQPATATVFIATAGPRTGTSMFCPSCYADCIKSAKTDRKGRFKIQSLDPTLIFRILVVAKDCKPKYVGSVDPAKGPVKVKLESQNYADSPPGNTLRGQVVDLQGKPIVGAVVEADGIRRPDGSATWGALKGVDPLAVTDERGEFLITSRGPFWAMDVKVEARDFARRSFAKLRSGTNRHDLTMTEGATVSGRVLWQGKPLPDVSVGLVSVNRDPENSTGHFEVGTDADGRFSFFNLPPNVKYNLYGIMRTLQDHGAVPLMEIATGDDGSKVDAGDLVVGPGHRLAGRIVLADGKTIPAKTRLLIARESAWDILQITLDADGRFETAEIPSDAINLSVRIPDYRVSGKNASLDTLNPFQLVGLVNTDITNLVLLLEKGPDLQFDYDAPDDHLLSGRPLHGAERGAGSQVGQVQSWQVSGHLIDAKTGKPIQNFQITPGETLYGRINLDRTHSVQGINGVYAVELDKRFVEPVLKAAADGYLPAAVTAPSGGATNFDLRLQPGSGPAGLVLLPNGKPAVNVTVGLVCKGEEGIAILNNKLEGWRATNRVQTTDAGGHFSFAPESQMECVAAASPDGFKLVSLLELAAHPSITLEPWGRVKGTLRRPTGPGTNEDLDLEFPAEAVPQRFSLNASEHVITDETGQFEFDNVPPGKLDLTYRVKLDDRGTYRSEPLQTITVIPGQTLELKIDARERVPQESYSIAPQPKPEQTRGSAMTGKVILPGGEPAALVQVALVVPREYISLGKAGLRTHADKSLETYTDETGHFSLPAVEESTELLAVGEQGFARLNLPSGKEVTLTLQPWGEIHGTLLIGRRLGSNQRVWLRENPGNNLRYSLNDFSTQTDDQGKFVITYIPPGAQHVARGIPGAKGGFSYGLGFPVVVKAGEITEVTIGGTGREVIVQAVFTNTPPTMNWGEIMFSLSTYSSPTNTPWQKNFHAYAPEPITNGNLVFEDVLPGRYELSAFGQRLLLLKNREYTVKILPLGNKEIIIPDTSAGQNDVSFDAGILDLRAIRGLNVGDSATPIHLKTATGNFELSDYRGKFLLLNFLAIGKTPSPELTQLREVFDAYGKNKELTMLSLSYRPTTFLESYARTNGIPWTLASVEPPVTDRAIADYLQFAPVPNSDEFSILIDPEGKIASINLIGAEIKEAVEKALAKR